MKKIIVGLLAIVLFAMFRNMSVDEKIIPDQAIRFRILANSNSKYDQDVKEQVRDKLQNNMYSLLKNTQSIDQARTIIKTNLSSFNDTVGSVLAKADPGLNYTIDFGTHYFPNKEYKGIKYDNGNYESLLVKLGKGAGDNWWCVLFPPLCLLEAEPSTDVEYKFFAQELIDKFF